MPNQSCALRPLELCKGGGGVLRLFGWLVWVVCPMCLGSGVPPGAGSGRKCSSDVVDEVDRGLGWCSVRELVWLLVFVGEGDHVLEGAGGGRLNHELVGCGACWLTLDVLMSCWIAAGSATVHWV